MIVALTDRDRMSVDLGEHLHPVADVGHPRRPDEHGVHGPAGDVGDVKVGLEGAQLAAEGVALGEDVQHVEMSRGRA